MKKVAEKFAKSGKTCTYLSPELAYNVYEKQFEHSIDNRGGAVVWRISDAFLRHLHRPGRRDPRDPVDRFWGGGNFHGCIIRSRLCI